MKKMKLILMVLFFSTSVFAQKNLSGTYVLNIAKSNFGTLTPEQGAAKEIKIVQKKDSIEIKRTLSSGIVNDVYAFDGKTVEQDLPDETKKTSKLKWNDDKKSFVIQANYKVGNNGNPWEYTRTETYRLSADGKILTLDRVTVIPDRTETVKAVYDKR